MLSKNVDLGALVTALAGGLVGIAGGSSALTPWGILGGFVAG